MGRTVACATVAVFNFCGVTPQPAMALQSTPYAAWKPPNRAAKQDTTARQVSEKQLPSLTPRSDLQTSVRDLQIVNLQIPPR
jgi:hypothetical protein